MRAGVLTDINEKAHAVALVPVTAVIVIMIVLVVTMLPVPKPVLVLVTLMSAPIIRPQLTYSSRQESGKDHGHRQQYFAVMPQQDIFHNTKVRSFCESG